MRRKLFCLAMSSVAGVISTYYFGIKAAFALCAAVIFTLSFLLPHQSLRRKLVFLLIIAVFFTFGGTRLYFCQQKTDSGFLSEISGQYTEITGRIQRIEQLEEEKYRIALDVRGEKLQVNLYQNLENYWEFCGKTVSFHAAVERPEPESNPRTFDYQLYLKSKDIHYTASAYSLQVHPDVPVGFFHRAQSVILEKREKMLDAVSVSKDTDGLLRGILFGDTSRLDEDIYKAFRQNGTAHLLAVSGLHVGILFGAYKMVTKRRKSIFYTIFFVILLLVYGTASMWSPSVCRAVFLIFLMLFADFLDRRYDLLTGLSIAVLFAIMNNPYVLFGAAFQMSFLAVISIAFLLPSMQKLAGEAFGVLLAVQLGLLPYMAYTFNYISFTGFLCNNPLILLTSALVPAGIGTYLWFFIYGFVPDFMTDMLNGLCYMMIKLNGFFHADGFLSFDVVSPPFWFMGFIYFLLFFGTSEYFFLCRERKEKKKILVSVLMLVLITVSCSAAGSSDFDKAEMVFLDVGQGDCLHIKGEDGAHYLIDGGGSDRYNVGEKILKPYLLKNGCKSVDVGFATHKHLDHYLGLQQLSEVYPVKQIVTKGKAGDKFFIGEEQWVEILWPQEVSTVEESSDENENSMVFMVHSRGLKTLITGDLTAEAEKMMLKKYAGTEKLTADVLKVAHHGSAYSTTDEFLQAVNPKLAVISVGKNNYGHPSQLIIEKLQKNGIMVFRTDHSGAVGLIWQKGRIRICTENR